MTAAFFLGTGGLMLGALAYAIWVGLGLLFGLPLPTESQGGGMLILSTASCATAGLMISFFAD